MVAGETRIKAVHVQEVIKRIDALRQRRGFAPATYTSLPLQGGAIWASHFAEAISALAAVYREDGISPPSYGRVVAGEPIRAATINALRAGVTDREGRPVTPGVSTTADHHILVELLPDDTAPPNLFDLNGRSLVFTPDGHGRYSRAVRPLAWEEPIGPSVTDGDEIALEGFVFDFAGRRWDSFHVSRHGLLTFGAPLAYNYQDNDNRFNTMREIASKFVDVPTISALFKPRFGGSWTGNDPLASQHVAHRDDRVVVTWFAADEWGYYPGGIRPSTADNRYQAVLHADGAIAFNYQKITVGDGIVGLFDAAEIAKGHLIAGLPDPTDPELPGHLDLLDAALYATNADSNVILEFTLREPIPEPGAGDRYSYRLHFDTDEPYWNHPLDWSDEDVTWQIDVGSGGEYVARGDGVQGLLAGDGETRIALLADPAVLGGDGGRISTMVVAGAAHFRDDQWVQGDYDSRAMFEFVLDVGGTREVDLSQSDGEFSERQSEIFHYRGPPDLADVSCRVLDALGGDYDLLVFHSEFRVDGNQEGGSPWRSYGDNATGTGRQHHSSAPCGGLRFRGHFARPDWIPGMNGQYLDADLALFAHEFIHTWAAYLSYERNGRHEPLTDTICGCHWRVGLHTPAAFPWRGGDAMSNMTAWGGGFWRDNGDGTFTSVARYNEGGPSWLDLYVMGLASASEVPDMFLLRNLRRIDGRRYAGDKEIISIDQVVAANGPRTPGVAESQNVFNAGFVYLVEPGRTPSRSLLDVHAKYRRNVEVYWDHITGERSRVDTTIRGGDGSPAFRSTSHPARPARSPPRTIGSLIP